MNQYTIYRKSGGKKSINARSRREAILQSHVAPGDIAAVINSDLLSKSYDRFMGYTEGAAIDALAIWDSRDGAKIRISR